VSSARADILARVRTAAGAREPTAAQARLSERPRGPLPRLEGALLDRFEARLSLAAATVARVESAASLPQAVSEYLDAQGVHSDIVLAAHELLDVDGWPAGRGAVRRALRAEDAVGVTVAECAVAETGSLVMLSGPHTPTAFNFLPETCICAVRTADVVAHLEDVWLRLRERGLAMPRALNFVTGPSRTADVEQTIQLGAHGPRRLHVLLVGA
jgi:L-lactate utilization protein LutC